MVATVVAKVKDRDGRLLRAKELLQAKLESKDQELAAAQVCGVVVVNVCARTSLLTSSNAWGILSCRCRQERRPLLSGWLTPFPAANRVFLSCVFAFRDKLFASGPLRMSVGGLVAFCSV